MSKIELDLDDPNVEIDEGKVKVSSDIKFEEIFEGYETNQPINLTPGDMAKIDLEADNNMMGVSKFIVGEPYRDKYAIGLIIGDNKTSLFVLKDE